jgi:hypothetical protein
MRPLAALALTSVLALGGCSAQRPAPVVCYHLNASDCLMVAAAVLADERAESSAALVVVVPWRGCFPGTLCRLFQSESPLPLVATVGIRFDDGSRSVLRQTGSLDDRPLIVTAGPVNVGADTFIDAYANTRGVLLLGTLPVTSRPQ